MVLLLPSYFINNGTSHDWGGDFAMYLQQAENIVSGMPQADNGYIYNQECPGVGPSTYPIGFPLLLAPVMLFFGNDMAVLIDYMALLFILLGSSIFMLLRSKVGFGVGLIAALTIVYHPTLLEFKREVMSDVPFALFAISAVLAAAKRKWLIAGLIMAMAASIRTVGLSLILATVLLAFLDVWNASDFSFSRLIKNSKMKGAIVASAGYVFINHLLFATSSEAGYKAVFALYDFKETITGNAALYWDYVQQLLFTQSDHFLVGVGFLTLCILAVVGWVKKTRLGYELADVWLPIYLLVLLVYPYRGGALRFMLPAVPFLFYYAGLVPRKPYTAMGLVLLVFLALPFGLNFNKAKDFSQNWSEHLAGPQSLASVELFEFIQASVPRNDAILFLKPRVLAYYGDRRSMSNERQQPAASIKNQLDTIPVQHLLSATLFGTQALTQYLRLTQN